MNKIAQAAQVVINRSLELKRQESLLIITDDPHVEIADQLMQAAAKKTRHVHLLRLHDDYLAKNHLCDATIAFMQSMNAVIAVTNVSLSHLDGRREACRKGVRFISMPGVTNETFGRIALMDFDKIGRLSRKLKDILTIAKKATVTAPNGTNLTITLASRKGYADTGLVSTPGAFSNLPAGEASIAPEENGVDGEMVVDCGMGVTPEDTTPLCLIFKEGKVTRITGDDNAERLRRLLAPFGADGRKAAEFGIGANDAARINNYPLEDEKVLGTIHVALGNNLSFGGNNNVALHLDGVVYKASVAIDGRKILENGKLMLE
jgi:leucyl aminopeptidase (aminopeptidase T)